MMSCSLIGQTPFFGSGQYQFDSDRLSVSICEQGYKHTQQFNCLGNNLTYCKKVKFVKLTIFTYVI